MTSKKSLYSSMQPLEEPVTVIVGNNARCPTEGKGTISFVTANGETRKISDVLYVLKIKRNLLSIAAITDQGHVVKFTKTGVEILNDGGKVIRIGGRRNNLYELSALTTSIGVSTTKLWHERFEHIGHAVLKELSTGPDRLGIRRKFKFPVLVDLEPRGTRSVLDFDRSKRQRMGSARYEGFTSCEVGPTSVSLRSFCFLQLIFTEFEGRFVGFKEN